MTYKGLNNLVDRAIDYIVETQENSDYICETNGEWCVTNCISTLNRNCVKHYLLNKYNGKRNE